MKYFLLIILTCTLASVNAQIITTFAGGGSGGDGSLAVDANIGFCATGSFDAIGNFYFAANSFAPQIKRVNIYGIVETVAGTGVYGYSGDGGLAINAAISTAMCRVDSVGNIYIADYYNRRLRKVDAATGIIHTIAGDGFPGHTGDGGPAINAKLLPLDLCIGRNGDIYVSDSVWVRKIDVNGIITTIAGNGTSVNSGDGGPATLAGVLPGFGICLDTAGNLYFGELVIRKIDIATGIISTVGGTGTYLYNGDNIPAPTANFRGFGLAFDKSNNLFISDYGNQRVRMIDANGLIHTVAGTGVMGYSGDGGMADTAQIFDPEGVSFDMCGNLYIADEANRRIRKVTYNPTCIPIDTNHHNEAVVNVAAIDFSISPNPANTEITVNAGNGFINSITLFNTLGQQVYMSQFTNTTKTTIDISYLPPGIYLLKVNDTYIKKVIKQ
jgi:hypothetical protein